MRLAFPLTTTGGVAARVSSGFQDHLNRTPPSKTPGADIVIGRPRQDALTEGAAVVAAAAGVIRRAGATGTGFRVEIDHGNSVRTVYRHMKNPRFATVAGLPVLAGQTLADASFNPKDAGKVPHLHFELRLKGVPVDQARFLALRKSAPVGTIPSETPDETVRAVLLKIAEVAKARAVGDKVRAFAPWLLLIWYLSSRG